MKVFIRGLRRTDERDRAVCECVCVSLSLCVCLCLYVHVTTSFQLVPLSSISNLRSCQTDFKSTSPKSFRNFTGRGPGVCCCPSWSSGSRPVIIDYKLVVDNSWTRRCVSGLTPSLNGWPCRNGRPEGRRHHPKNQNPPGPEIQSRSHLDRKLRPLPQGAIQELSTDPPSAGFRS